MVRRRDSESESESFSSSSSTDNSTMNEEHIGEIRPYNFQPRFMPSELENMNIEAGGGGGGGGHRRH